MHGSKTQKNFYIRPTTGVGSKGGFSVERRDQYSKRDTIRNNTNSHNGNGDNLLLQVNSYGFRPPTSQENNNFLTEQDAMRIASNRLSKLSPIVGSNNNNNLQRFSSQTQLHGNFQGSSQANQFRNISISSQQQQRIHAQKNAFSPFMQKQSSSAQQLNQQYRIVKHLSQDQFQDNQGLEGNFRKTISSFSGLDALNSRSSLHQQERSPTQQIMQQISRSKEQDMFEVDISNVNEVNSNEQEERNNHKNEELNLQEDDEEEEQEEQLSEIRIKEVQNFEDSLDDIEQLATSGFEFNHMQKNKQLLESESARRKSEVVSGQPTRQFRDEDINQGKSSQMETKINGQDQFSQSKQYLPATSPQLSSKTQAQSPLVHARLIASEKQFSSVKQFDSVEDISASNELIISQRIMPTDKKSPGQTYNFTNSKQSDETAASQTIPKTPFVDTNQNSYKENNRFQLINLKQNGSPNGETLLTRPPTTNNNNKSRIRTALSKQMDFHQTPQINFYELFAGHSQGIIKQSKMPFFHNFYRSEQLKNLVSDISAPTTTFSVKKAQIFAMPPKQTVLMSRQGQRNSNHTQTKNNSNSSNGNKEIILNSAPVSSQNAIASKIQQQLMLGITGRPRTIRKNQ